MQTPAMVKRFLVLLLGLSAILLPGDGSAQSLRVTVLSIGDGDTIRVRQSGRSITVRLACIDAPETAQSPYGQQARRFLQQRLPIGREVTLDVKTTDRYGRTVAEVLRNGRAVNLTLVRSGAAFAYRQYLAKCDQSAYLGAEAAAQRERVGVWAVPGGIQRPWDWRHGGRTAAPAPSVLKGSGPAPAGHRYKCREIGSFARAQELLKQGHTYLDRDGDGVACESLQ